MPLPLRLDRDLPSAKLGVVHHPEPRELRLDHAPAVALNFMFYNLVNLHKFLRVMPAMAAGVIDRLWEIEDIVRLID